MKWECWIEGAFIPADEKTKQEAITLTGKIILTADDYDAVNKLLKEHVPDDYKIISVAQINEE